MTDIPALTGFRGLLSIWVLLYHVYYIGMILGLNYGEYFPRAVTDFLNNGGLGVDGFFLLSGFVLSHVYSESLSSRLTRADAGRFIWLRFARIYPVHLVILCVYAALIFGGVAFDDKTCGVPDLHAAANVQDACRRFGFSGFLSQLTLTSAWGWQDPLTWNKPAWSISAEWMAYLCFPFLLRAFRFLRDGFAALALAFLCLLLQYAWMSYVKGYPLELIPNESSGLDRIMYEFAAGMLMYKFYRSPRYARIPWRLMSYACVAGMALIFYLRLPPLLVSPVFMLLILAIAQPNGAFTAFLSKPTSVWFGRISYSLYMCHVLIMETLGATFGTVSDKQLTWPAALAMMSGIVVLSVLLAAALYRFVEEPCRKKMRAVSGIIR